MGLIRRGKWRKLHNDVLRDLYYSQNAIKVIKITTTKNKNQGARDTYEGEKRWV